MVPGSSPGGPTNRTSDSVGNFGKIFDALVVDHDGVLDDNEWIGARTHVAVINYSTLGYAEQLATDRG